MKRNIYLCFVYIKPYQCKDLSEIIFSEIQSDITVYSSLGDILISDDFNARTGGLEDFKMIGDIILNYVNSLSQIQYSNCLHELSKSCYFDPKTYLFYGMFLSV
jgi:hypothetical protein